MSYIVRSGATPLTAWYIQAPSTWTGDKDKATKFDTVEQAEAGRENLIAVRYPKALFKPSKIVGVRNRCQIIEVAS